MKRRSIERRATLRDKIIGLGEKSTRKSYYPELQQRLEQLQEKNRRLTREIEDRKQAENTRKRYGQSWSTIDRSGRFY